MDSELHISWSSKHTGMYIRSYDKKEYLFYF